MKTDSILRLGRAQYRQLAELAKLNGCCLSIGTVKELGGNWGLFSPWARPVHADAQSDDRRLAERVVIQIATTVDAGRLRNVQRPEIAWDALEDAEVFHFITQHEIGHRIDNYFGFDIWKIADPEVRATCERVISVCNEVLADRYAWAAIRPGEPVPLCETGKRQQDDIAAAMALLDQHMPRTRRAPQALPAGQYSFVPQSMLETLERAEFVGPRIAPALLERAHERRRVHRRDTRARKGAFA